MGPRAKVYPPPEMEWDNAMEWDMKLSAGGKKGAGGRKSAVGGTQKGALTKIASEKSKKSSKQSVRPSSKMVTSDVATAHAQVNEISGNGQPPTTLPQMWMYAPQGINNKGRSTWWEAIEVIQSGRQPAPLHRLKGKLLIPWLNAQLLRKGIRAEQLRLYREESKGPAVLLSVNKVKVVNNMLNHPHVQNRGPVRLGPVYAVERS